MKTLKIIILSFLLFLTGTTNAQQDSVEYYMDLTANEMAPDERLVLCNQLLKHASAQRDTMAMINGYNFKAWSFFYLSQMDSAIQCYWQQYQLANEIKDNYQMGKSLYNLAGTYSIKLQHQESIRLYKRALTLFSMEGDSSLVALVYRDMASNCADINLFASAHENLEQAMKLDKSMKNNIGLANDYATLGDIYSKEINDDYNQDPNSKTLRKQLERLNQCLDSIPILIPSDADEFDKLTTLAAYHGFKTEYEIYCIKLEPGKNKDRHIERASYFNDQYLQIAAKLQDEEFMINGKIHKSEIEWMKGHKELAMAINDSLKNCLTDSIWGTHIITVYKRSAEYNTELKNYEQAISDYQEYNRIRQKTMNDKVIRANAEFRSDVRTQEQLSKMIEEQDRDRMKKDEEVHRQKLVTLLISIILMVVIVAAIVILIALKQNRKFLNQLRESNVELSQRQEEIQAQRDIINEQKDKVEKGRNIILESISYARQIQHAALPSADAITKLFPDSFVFYKPKDIVSGDFYYVSQNAGWNNFILGDCTGHGVPGGFLSMLGMSALQEILRDPDKDILPDEILGRMRNYVKRALSNDEENLQVTINGEEEEFSSSSANGMDMTVLQINYETRQLRFGAAYQNLHIVRKGEVLRIKGDHMPVARHIKEDTPFQTQTMEIYDGDMIYLTSDGIASQINSQNKKFMSKRLIEFFQENYTYACKIQKMRLAHLMDEWCLNTIQVDDMCLAGIRIGLLKA